MLVLVLPINERLTTFARNQALDPEHQAPHCTFIGCPAMKTVANGAIAIAGSELLSAALPPGRVLAWMASRVQSAASIITLAPATGRRRRPLPLARQAGCHPVQVSVPILKLTTTNQHAHGRTSRSKKTINS